MKYLLAALLCLFSSASLAMSYTECKTEVDSYAKLHFLVLSSIQEALDKHTITQVEAIDGVFKEDTGYQKLQDILKAEGC